jgi:hypothetical protein
LVLIFDLVNLVFILRECVFLCASLCARKFIMGGIPRHLSPLREFATASLTGGKLKDRPDLGKKACWSSHFRSRTPPAHG